MKKLFIVVFLSLLFLANQVSAQTANPNFVYLDTNKLFKSSLTITFTTGTTALGRQLAQGTSASGEANTSTSINILPPSGDITLYFKSVNVDGSQNFTVEYGIFKGVSQFSTDGYEWNTLWTITSDGTKQVSIKDQAFNISYPSSYHAIRIVETGNQSNKYTVDWECYK